MTQRQLKYLFVGSLALLIAVPAIAHSQGTPRRGSQPQRQGQGFAAGPNDIRGPQRGQRVAGRRHGGGQGRMARGQGNGRRRMGGRSSLAQRALRSAERIGLTGDQRAQVEQAQHAQREASINRRAAMQVADLYLRALMTADTRDTVAIEATLREGSDNRIAEQMGALHLDASIAEILTAEQIGLLKEDRGRHRGRR